MLIMDGRLKALHMSRVSISVSSSTQNAEESQQESTRKPISSVTVGQCIPLFDDLRASWPTKSQSCLLSENDAAPQE